MVSHFTKHRRIEYGRQNKYSGTQRRIVHCDYQRPSCREVMLIKRHFNERGKNFGF